MSVSKKDIAEHLGISRSAVSQALNNTPGSTISEETRQRIIEAARKLGYPLTEESRKLCFILYNREEADPRYMYDLQSIEKAVGSLDYSLIFKNVKSSPHEMERIRQFLLRREVEGCIVTGDVDSVFVDLLEKTEIPYLFFGGTIRENTHAVMFDHKMVTLHAARQLIEFGHRRIAFFVGPLEYPIHQLNLAAYKEALEEAGIAFEPSLVQVSREEDGYELCQRMKYLGIPYTAAICANTVIQFSALQYLKEAGVKVPQEVSLIGNGYSELVELSKPRLTTVYGDPAQNELAVLRLVDIIRKKVKTPEIMYLHELKVIEGGTIAYCSAGDDHGSE
ncbi:LacI family DNA-binding transcriptional regulator [Paenibacillus sp. GYB003]|uniref:LacI family DNA-binding transcriptional regulator n=1 Tax=Paenibacillus sp. GYB003 TaxID=2994392 RepID=UPI002F96B8CD